jgi:hypothetical protein
VSILRAYPEEVEADIARFYPGRDIGQFWRGDLSGRALGVLIRYLPEDSATVRAMRGTPWSELMYLLAHIADTVAYSRADYANVHGGKTRPEPVQRPDTAEQRDQRDHVRHVHDALTAAMGGTFVVDAPTDGRRHEPETETV